MKYSKGTLVALVAISLAYSAYAQTGGSRIAPVGTSFLISTAGPDAVGGRPGIAHDGTNFLAAWRAPDGTIGAARVSAAGTVLDPSGIAISAGTAVPSVGFGGGNFLVVWVNGGAIRGARIAPNGALVDSPPLEMLPSAQAKDRPPSIAFDGTNYLIVWRNYGDVIYGARISSAGVSLDGAGGFAISNGSDFYPWVCYGVNQFMVIWHGWGANGLDIFGARVTPSGTVVDPGGFVIAQPPEDQDHASIAFDGTNYLVVWHDYRGTGEYSNGTAYGIRISQNAAVLDANPFQISDRTLWQVPVLSAFDGTDFFVAWHADMSPANFRLADVFGRRVGKDGSLLGEKPIGIGTAAYHQWGPIMGFGGGRFLLAWTERRPNAPCSGGCIFGQVLERKTSAPGSPATAASLERPRIEAPGDISWETLASPTSDTLHTVVSSGSDSASAVGEGCNVARYVSGNWSSTALLPYVGRLFAMWAGDASNIWTLGWCWAMAHFDGQSWGSLDCQTSGQDDSYQIGFGIWGRPDGTVVTVGTNGAYEVRDQNIDGGLYYGRTGSTVSLWDAWGTAAGAVYAVGELGAVLRIEGFDWTPVSGIPTVQNLNGIWGAGPDDIFAVGDFGTILHYDGVSWTEQASGTSEHLFAVSGFNGRDVYAVGFRGTILHHNGTAWAAESSGTAEHLLDVSAAANAIWAVGDHGVIVRKTVTGYSLTGDLPDLDRDDKADITVWRPGDGQWFALPSASPGSYSSTRWGAADDKPTPGDYDGDGRTDIAIWRPSSGIWYILPSKSPGSYISRAWGISTDVPVPADYDGDGKTDIAVWRPDSGRWYVLPSAAPGTYTETQWGSSTDIPVPADYDGDRRADTAVWRPVSQTWYILPTSAPRTFTAKPWGVSTDIPVPADYDGDGLTDIAVLRPESWTWFVLPSGSPGTYAATRWGGAGDVPVAADFDKDGKADIGAFRPGSGTWYVLPSGSPGTHTATQWGSQADLPISVLTRILGSIL